MLFGSKALIMHLTFHIIFVNSQINMRVETSTFIARSSNITCILSSQFSLLFDQQKPLFLLNRMKYVVSSLISSKIRPHRCSLFESLLIPQ